MIVIAQIEHVDAVRTWKNLAVAGLTSIVVGRTIWLDR